MGYSFPTTLQGWVALGPSYGLQPGNNVPMALWPAALASVQRNLKSAQNPPPANQVNEVQAMLICRGLIYQKATPGDCGVPTSIDFTNVSITQGAGQVASGIASLAGTSLPGIGAAVQAITAIFQHHDQAVATEQATLCSVTQLINQVIPYYDNLVRIGAVSPATAISGIQGFIQQVNAKMSAIAKQCDAACVYISVMAAHADFLNTYYPAIAPIQAAAHAPGAPPSSIIPTAPGGVIQVGNAYPGGNTVAVAAPSSGIYTTQPVAVPGSPPLVVPQPQSETAVYVAIAIVIGIIILALAG
jgi:hypothetical protein